MKGQVARGHSVHFRVKDLGDPSYAATNNVKPFSLCLSFALRSVTLSLLNTITGYLLCLYSILMILMLILCIEYSN